MEWNHDVFQQILNSNEVRDKISQMGDRVAAAAGDGFESEVIDMNYGGSPRPGAIVEAKTREAKLAEATDKALTRALNAASGA